jgi:hypothetical protein
MCIYQSIEWLNGNSGAAMAFLTLVYVITTIVIVIISTRTLRKMDESNKLSEKSIIQSMAFEKQRNRPYVIFDLIIENNVIYAELKNIGETPAIDVNIILDEKLAYISADKKAPSFSERPIVFMAPKRVIRDFINMSFEIFKNEQTHVYKSKIIYKNKEGDIYEEDSIVDIDHNKGLTYLLPPEHLKDITNELKNVNRQLQEVSDALNYLAWEQNSAIEDKYHSNLVFDEKFDANDFIKKHFKNSVSWDGKLYFNFLTCRSTIENEKMRNNLLHCEKLGLLRRERSYFMLTERGHEIANSI